MDYWVNKNVKITILSGAKKLFYTALIFDINKNLVSFVDKYGDFFSYPVSSILEIAENKDDSFSIPEEKKQESQKKLRERGV